MAKKVFKFAEHKADYEKLWAACTVSPAHLPEIKKLAERILKGKARYVSIAEKLKAKIPHITWWIIGVIHHMEASCDFGKYQHNGELLGKVTKKVPKGILFKTWEDSAVDASMRHLQSLDGTIARALCLLEGFNGYGYRLYHPDVKTPYLWSYSNLYTKGKYVEVWVEKHPKTGKPGYMSQWKPDLVSKQAGTAVILKYLADAGEIDL